MVLQQHPQRCYDVTLDSPARRVSTTNTERKGGLRPPWIPWAGLWEAGSWDKPTVWDRVGQKGTAPVPQ